MLQLDHSLLIGKGLHRECFQHPENPALCVKVVVAGDSDENRREAKYYRFLQRRGISWEMLARFHGLLDTNMGEGAVFDLVRDGDGQVSATLAHYLQSKELISAYGPRLEAALAALKAYLLRERIVTMTLKAKNIAFQRVAGGGGRLVLVDNVGNSDFIPASNYSAWLARRKIQRKWHRFEQELPFDSPTL